MVAIHGGWELRERLIRRGIERIRLFKYESTAQQILEVFEDAAGNPMPETNND